MVGAIARFRSFASLLGTTIATGKVLKMQVRAIANAACGRQLQKQLNGPKQLRWWNGSLPQTLGMNSVRNT
eukprot:g28679.t1